MFHFVYAFENLLTIAGLSPFSDFTPSRPFHTLPSFLSNTFHICLSSLSHPSLISGRLFSFSHPFSKIFPHPSCCSNMLVSSHCHDSSLSRVCTVVWLVFARTTKEVRTPSGTSGPPSSRHGSTAPWLATTHSTLTRSRP